MRCRNCGWDNPDTQTICEKCNSPLEPTGGNPYQNYSQSAAEQPQSGMRSTVRESSIFGNQAQAGVQVQAAAPQQQETATCPTCGYPVAPGAQMCPACGTPMSNARAAQGFGNQAGPMGVQAGPMGVQAGPMGGKASPMGGKVCRKCGSPLPQGVRFCPTCGSPVRQMSGTVPAWDSPSMMQGDYGFCTLRPIAWARENRDYQPVSYSGNEIVLNRANTDPNNQTITSQQQAVLTKEADGWYIEDLSASHSTMIRVSRKLKLESGDVICLGNRLFEFND